MFAIVRDNEVKKIIQAHTAFEFEGKQYTAKWTSRWTQEEREAFGIKDVIHGSKEDDRFYYVSPNPVTLVDGIPTIVYTCIPKAIEDKEEVDEKGNPLFVKIFDPSANDGKGSMIDSTQRLVTQGLKTTFTQQVKSSCNSLLQPTDWMIVRKHERNIDIPAEVVTYRAAVITECNRLEAAIINTADIPALAAVVSAQNWPKL